MLVPLRTVYFAVFVTVFASSALAQDPVLIVENGAIVTYSLDDLKRLPQTDIETSNEFVDGMRRFSGPLARMILQSAGVDVGAKVAILTAANDYSVEVPVREFFEYDVIFALEMDGEELSRRDKGPIWVIYPTSEFEELQDPVYNSRLIWQLVRMELR